MGRKSVRDMGPLERWLHSLTVRSTIGVQLLALAVGAVVLFAGFMLYYKGIIYEYKVETSQMAKAESVMLDPEKTRVKTDEILSIYDSVPDSEKGDGFSPEYLEKFASVQDEQFRDIQRRMLHMKEEVGLRNAFIAAISESDGRMIYLVDSDPKPESFCQPGTWDVYPVEEMRELAHGEQKSSLQGKYGLKKHPNAAITHTERFGTRCTGGAVLYETERYTVMVCLDEKLDNLKEISKVFLMQYVVLLLCVLILIGVIAIILIRRTMVNPIDRMADAAHRYSEDKKSGNPATDHFRKLKIRKGNEIEELSLTMADMEDSLSEYVEIILAIYLLIVICLVIGRTVMLETPLIFTEGASLHHFLEASLTIAVSIEFLKMLCMHTPGTLIEVLLFAIARHMIVESLPPLQNLLIVFSIAVLFAVRRYLLTSSDQKGMNEHIHGARDIIAELTHSNKEKEALHSYRENVKEQKQLNKVARKIQKEEEKNSDNHGA